MSIGIGIVGTGMIGQMCHLANFSINPDCRVVAISDLRPALAASAAAKFGVPRVYPTHRDLLTDPNVTGVVVVTRRRATGPIVLDVLKSGRHALSEKPMAYTTEQANTLVDTARERNLIYGIGYMKRHDAGVAGALAMFQQLRANNLLGRIVRAHAWCSGGDTGGTRDNFVMTAEQRPDGLTLWSDGPDWMDAKLRPNYDTFLNVFSHIINLTRYFLGASPALTTSAISSFVNTTATLDFDGIPCTLDLANGTSGAWREGIEFIFEHGSLKIELPAPFESGAESRVTVVERGQTRELARGNTWAFRRQADAFVYDIIHRAPPLASGADSVADIDIAQQIWRRHMDATISGA